MGSHVLDQRVGLLLTGQRQCLVGFVVAPKETHGFLVQQGEHATNLGLGQRLLGVLTVLMGYSLLIEQGDRLATGRSGALADQLQHFGPPDSVLTSSWFRP